MKVGFYAVHKKTGSIFIHKENKMIYTKLHYLRCVITRTGSTIGDYHYYILKDDGTTRKLEGKWWENSL